MCVAAAAFVIGQWKNYTNTNDIRGFASTSGFVWIATTGGLVKFDPASEARQVFTNAEGLGGNFLLSVAADGRGNIWAGADNGTLTKFDLARNRFTVYPMMAPDGRALKLSAILPDSDRLWIGTDIGVALFLIEKNGGELKEIYRRLGTINIETPVRALVLFRDSIWAVTPQGVAGSSKDHPNLLDPSAWRSFRRSTNVGLNHEDCYSLLNFQDTLLIGTVKGIYAFVSDSGRFRRFRPEVDSVALVSSLASLADSLYAPLQFGLTKIIPTGAFLMGSDTVEGTRIFPALFLTSQNQLFTGTARKGFARWRGSFWSIYRPPGPPGNYFDDLAVDAAGKIWCANDVYGASMFDGAIWTILDPVVFPQIAGQAWGIDIDQAGNKWYSFWGAGATAVWGSGSVPDSVVRYDSTNAPFRRISGSDPSLIVTDVAVDNQGNVWFCNVRLDTVGPALVVRQPNGNFVTFGTSDGFVSSDIVALYPFGDHIWIAFKTAGTTAGVADLYFGGTVANKSGDRLTHYNKDNNFLLDNRVTALAVDRRGTVWAGTGLGLSRFNADFSIFETVPLPQPLGPQVNSVVVDSRNNKWVGTTSGLALITEEGEIFGPFLPENSGLAAPLINDMDFDPQTGSLWIGTTGGLSRLSTQVLEETDPPSGVEAFPNPFILRTGGERVYFRRLPLDARVRIYTTAGEEVQRLENTDFWDGKNAQGEYVASGVYLFLVHVPGQKSFTGKLALVRQL
ncbi:MAG TPA: two-component regulator propeller domain-containing protein [candidate division Zixibacteria bacterium]|nr:two-component regulator propeller domain-containing protein [candidate division Zixibacteria bacterium]